MKPIGIGFGNIVMSERVIVVLTPDTAPSKRLRERAKSEEKLLDATNGKKTRSLIVTDSNHVIMSAINSETIAARMEKGE